MPREQITYPDPEQGQRFRVSVGWDRTHYMQLGIQVSDSEQHITDVLFSDMQSRELLAEVFMAHLEQYGRTITDDNMVPGNPDHNVEMTREFLGTVILDALRNARPAIERDGLWVDIDRNEANVLVRMVRKARDAVFGRDE